MPLPLLTAPEMKLVEKQTTTETGISELQMITQAGAAVFRCAKQVTVKLPHSEKKNWIIICGKGHNGADGLQAAILAAEQDYKITLYQIFSDKGYSPETIQLHQQLNQQGIKVHFYKDASELHLPYDTALIIEGLLGAGVTNPARGLVAESIKKINQSSVPVLSIDIPSGLYTDETNIELHVKPVATISFGTQKLSSLFYPSAGEFGKTFFDKLCFPPSLTTKQPSRLSVFQSSDADASYPTRPYDAYKYSTGKILVIAGSKGMHGASILCSRAALNAGAGMVKLVVPAAMHNEVCNHTLEIISHGAGDKKRTTHFSLLEIEELLAHIEWADTVCLGPGLGRHPDTIAFLLELIPQISKPLVIDGDGLHFFYPEVNPQIIKLQPENQHIIVTPHAGEYKRMGGFYQYNCPLEHIKGVQNLASNRGVTLLLKGPTTTISDAKGHAIICPPGNPGLATAGTGDVLAGVITALVHQADTITAASLGVFLHNTSANLAQVLTGISGMTASDVLNHIPHASKQIEDRKQDFA
ncbi:MAG: NAD(P)H-hydrate dehydratase [Fibrobacteria bacterium]|nr:NAD(P)H-hydrate dehydratase [Fibrobacteria bacterium]